MFKSPSCVNNSTSSNVIFQTTDGTPDTPSIIAIARSNTQIDIERTAGASDGNNSTGWFDIRGEINLSGIWDLDLMIMQLGDLGVSLIIDLSNIGDTFNATGVLTVSTSTPLPVSITLLELLANGISVACNVCSPIAITNVIAITPLINY